MQPRFHHPNLDFALGHCRKMIEKSRALLADPQVDPGQVVGFFVGELLTTARHMYCAGQSVEEIRPTLVESAKCYLELLSFRGASQGIPVVEVVVSDRSDGKMVTGTKQRSTKKDYSETNSRNTCRSVYTALAVGEMGLANEIASQIWDPPNATYLGKGSVVCTDDQQKLSYGLKHYMAGESDEALLQLKGLTFSQHVLPFTEAALIRSLCRMDPEFIDELHDYLAKHREKFEATNDSDCYICLVGLALARLGVQSGLIQLDELPSGDVFFPLDFLTVE